MRRIFWLLLIVAAVFEVSGDYFMKRWADTNSVIMFIISVSLYFVLLIFWGLSLRYGELGKAAVISSMLGLLGTVTLAVMVFGEQLTLAHKVGIGCALVSLALLRV